VRKLVLICIYLSLTIPCAATIITVNWDGTGDYLTIQEGIDAAVSGTDTVEVAEGTYYEKINFNGKNIILTSTDPTDPNVVADTVIDGSNSGSVVTFAGTEDPNCILTGFTIQNGNTSNEGGGIHGNGTQAIITNCTITGNTADGVGGGGVQGFSGAITDCTITNNSAWYGGGIYGCNGSITNCVITFNIGYMGGGFSQCNGDITDCEISNNTADSEGGGIYNCNGVIANCTINNNTSVVGGGGVQGFSGQITGCVISGNSSKNGGGLSYCDGEINKCTVSFNSAIKDPVNYNGGEGGGLFNCNASVTDCIITDNGAESYGGGSSRCQGTITNSIISNNMAGYQGGGLSWCYGAITGCAITGNIADYGYGGGLSACSGPIINSLITGNIAHRDGGGIIDGEPDIINCTITNNIAYGDGGGYYGCDFCDPTFVNCIIWGNTAVQENNQIYIRDWYEPDLSFSCIQDWSSGGTGNINVDPNFVSPGYWDPNDTPSIDSDDFWIDGDFHLKSNGWRWDNDANDWTYDDVTSPCIDAGNPGSPLADEPMTLYVDPTNRWGENIRINMGAYGGTTEASMPPPGWTLLADLTNDGIVSLTDFANQAKNWQNTAPTQPGDLNRNGTVNLSDSLLMATDWLNTTTWH